MPNFLITIVIGLVSRCHLFGLCMERSELFGPGIIEDAERQVRMIRENLRIAQTRRKSYADNRRRDLEFTVGDYVYLKVSPIRGLRRFKVKGKLAPRYIGPFKIIDRKGEVAYQPELSTDYREYTMCSISVRVHEERLREDELNVRDDLTYTEYPNPNFGNGREDYRNKVIKMCKVKWSHHTARKRLLGKERMTSEQITRNSLLANPKISGRDFFKGVGL
ncbi:hypothetical protein U9M48_039934 [Paspalum notatum var. saurae]|uniref:Tf2-1-like SH3-like domain-containing protein n=1 Tax=Paspalum notatum var. saurae TaxID=547442 RepID=A0AAQ3UKM9_PASNO